VSISLFLGRVSIIEIPFKQFFVKWRFFIMKITRLLALSLIALLVIGAMGVLSQRSLAQTEIPAVADECSAETEDDDAAEASETGADTDSIELECGEQHEDEDGNENAACNVGEDDDAAEAAESGPDVDDIQEGCNDENEDGTEDLDEAEEAPSVDTQITAEEAITIAEAANPGSTSLEVEFEREGGVELWEVELDSGVEVQINANSGEILLAEADD
jgi:uncharacterized membrane protein YkoI